MTATEDDAILRDALREFLRPATLLEERWLSVPEAVEQLPASACHWEGAPYGVEPWPRCAHDVEMEFLVQVDHAAALHETRFSGLHMVFVCAAPARERFEALRAGTACPPCIRHVSDPDRSRPFAPTADLCADDMLRACRPIGRAEIRPPDALLEGLGLEQLPLGEPWPAVFRRLKDAGELPGVGPESDHLGGWHYTRFDRRVMPPACPECGGAPTLVIHQDSGDVVRSLWLCPDHPMWGHYAAHR